MSLSQTIIYGIVFSLMVFLYVVCLQDMDLFTLNPNKKSVDVWPIVSVSAMRINRRSAYFYNYEYEVDYEIITIEINFGTTYRQFREGDLVKIWYDKSNKEDIVAAVMSLIAGIVAVLIGLYVGMFVCCC